MFSKWRCYWSWIEPIINKYIYKQFSKLIDFEQHFEQLLFNLKLN
jgi:hypothetical protein